MNKSIVFFVCALVVLSESATTIMNLEPNGTNVIVNECPTFSWSKSRMGGTSYTITVKKSGSTYKTLHSNTNMYTIKPTDIGDFLTTGDFTWQVKSDKTGDQSEDAKFKINSLSCIPPKVGNKIDNSLSSFQQSTENLKGDSARNVWDKNTSIIFGVGEKIAGFYPFGNEKIFTLALHETWPEDEAPKDKEFRYANASVSITPTIGDNFFAFRYVFYTSGNSTIFVSVEDSAGNPVELEGSDGSKNISGCIGVSEHGNQCEPCAPDGHKPWPNHFSKGLEGDDRKWSLFIRKLSQPRTDDSQLKLKLSYVRYDRLVNDSYEPGAANYLFFASEFVFGQCSSIPENYYDEVNTTEGLSEYCLMCNSAKRFYPQSHNGHCLSCSAEASIASCSAASYCTPCSNSVCESSFESTCQETADCSSKEPNECDGVCSECDLEEDKCVFVSDKDTSCKKCSTLTKQADCASYSSSCAWCPTLQICVPKADSSKCPDCSILDEKTCTLKKTSNACQFCSAQTKCLNSAATCNESCVLAQTQDTCGGDDCQWCLSKQKCTEKRIECKECYELGKTECGKSGFPGCSLCDSGYCTDDTSQCPICNELEKDNCLYVVIDEEVKVPLDCKFCESSLKCMDLDTDCKNCSSISNSTECRGFVGCLYCKSDLKCMTIDGDTKECECEGMAASTCTKHNKGCCYSTADKLCYEITDDRCKTTLSTEMIIVIGCVCGFVAIAIIILVPTLICCCKPKPTDGIEMSAPGTIVVLPEGQPSMVVAQESLASVNGDPATAVSIDETAGAATATVNVAAVSPSQSMQDMQNMQNMQMMAQQQMLSMMAQQQMMNSMGMMNPMMMNSMGMMNMSGMGGMSGMGSMGMDMNSMNMTGGMNSMNMTGGMNSMGNGMGNMMATGGNGMQPQQGNTAQSQGTV